MLVVNPERSELKKQSPRSNDIGLTGSCTPSTNDGGCWCLEVALRSEGLLWMCDVAGARWEVGRQQRDVSDAACPRTYSAGRGSISRCQGNGGAVALVLKWSGSLVHAMCTAPASFPINVCLLRSRTRWLPQ